MTADVEPVVRLAVQVAAQDIVMATVVANVVLADVAAVLEDVITAELNAVPADVEPVAQVAVVAVVPVDAADHQVVMGLVDLLAVVENARQTVQLNAIKDAGRRALRHVVIIVK